MDDLKQQAIKLRTEDKMSILNISRKLRTPKSTVGKWLKPYPISKADQLRSRSASVSRARKSGLPEVEYISRRRDARSFDDPYAEVAPSKKGRAAELIFSAKCLLAGLEVFSAVTEDGRVDLIVGGRRCQVKTLRAASASVPLRKMTHRTKTGQMLSYVYSADDFDVLVAVNLSTFDCYAVDMRDIAAYQATISLSGLERFCTVNDLSCFQTPTPT
jgi:hypothetical protein